jgi:S-sulfo-L-cysteine synthase (O-acetyl-L-serine-dependent)
VSAIGTTGTITGISRFLKSRNPGVQIVGAQPAKGSKIPGIRAWPPEYAPKVFDPSAVDRTVEVTQSDAEETARRPASEECVFGGVSEVRLAQGVPNCSAWLATRTSSRAG